MSDIPTDYLSRLNLADLVSKIERQQEETRKFAAEQHKLTAEERKLIAEAAKLDRESRKLNSEAAKLDRDRVLAPWAIVATTAGIVVAASISGGLIASVIAHFWH